MSTDLVDRFLPMAPAAVAAWRAGNARLPDAPGGVAFFGAADAMAFLFPDATREGPWTCCIVGADFAGAVAHDVGLPAVERMLVALAGETLEAIGLVTIEDAGPRGFAVDACVVTLDAPRAQGDA